MLVKTSTFISVIIVFSFIITAETSAQSEYIIVEKAFSNRQIPYESGDNITYKLKGEEHFRKDVIVALNDTAIEFHYYQVQYHEIAEVDVRDRRFSGTNWRSIGGKLQFVGIGYIAVDQFNQVVVRGQDASFNQGVWIAGGAIFVAGTLLKRLSPKIVKLKGKYRIRYMNVGTYGMINKY